MIRFINSQIFVNFLIFATFSDSYPIFPSVYRPLFLWILLLVFPIALFQKIKFQKGYLYILFSLVYMGINGMVISLFKYEELIGVCDYVVTTSLSIIAYISYVYLFDKIELNKLKKAINGVGIFLVILGFLETFSYYGLLPTFIKYYLNILLTGSYLNRLKIISAEASWAAMTLLFFFVFYLNSKSKLKMLLVAVLIIATFSTQGILSLVIYIFCYLFLKYRLKAIKYFILTIVLSIIVFFLLKKILLLLNMQDLYFARRLFIINNIELNKMLYIDDSIFVRLGYPWIALKIGFSNIYNFILGIGGGNYRLEFLNMMVQEFPDYFYKNTEVMYNIKTLTATPKNLITRVFAEGGIVALITFFYGYFKVYKNATNYNKNNLLLLMILYLQFDSYVYLLFPLTLAMVQVYDKKIQKI